MNRSSCASGNGVRPLVFNGILRGQHGQNLGQLVRHAVDADLTFLHGLQQGGLCLGWSAVDLVRQNDVGEQGAGSEPELRCLGLEDVDARDIGRHEIGCELDSREPPVISIT